jgi:tetratricopeptide (TPR) repeat protein
MSVPDRSPARLAREARAAFERGALQRSLEGFHEAERLYHEQGDELDAAEMANNRAVTLIQLERPREALDALMGTPDLFLEAGDAGRAALSIGNLAAAYEALGEGDKAEAFYLEAAERFRQLGMEEEMLHTSQSLSRLLLDKGEVLEALFAMQRGVETRGRPSLRHRVLRSLMRIPSRLLGR